MFLYFRMVLCAALTLSLSLCLLSSYLQRSFNTVQTIPSFALPHLISSHLLFVPSSPFLFPLSIFPLSSSLPLSFPPYLSPLGLFISGSAAGIFMTNSFDMVDSPQGLACGMYVALARYVTVCRFTSPRRHIDSAVPFLQHTHVHAQTDRSTDF
jgi:hypothetical protein